MKNQNGEATLFCVLILVALSGLLTLCSLELQYSFGLLKKRTHIFLCVKETKGELHRYLKHMGRLNWLIKNTSRAQAVAVFFPPLWPHVANADKLKRLAKTFQAAATPLYFDKIRDLKKRGCPIDPQIYLNPYELGSDYGFRRTLEGTAKIRKTKWTYHFLEKPYFLTLKVDAARAESLYPRVDYLAEEKTGTLSSLLSSR